MLLDTFRFNEAGGRVEVSAFVDTRPSKMFAQSQFLFTNMQVNKVLFVLENFGQKTLRHDQVEGRLNAQGAVSMHLNQTLGIKLPTVEAAVHYGLTDGVLRDFKPAQALSRYVNKEELATLHFAAKDNYFMVKNETVTIPEMDIQSNIIRAYVQGTHSFTQDMDYHFRIPIKYIRTSSMDADRSEKAGNILLTLRGKPDSLKVGYDMAALKDRIRNSRETDEYGVINYYNKKMAPGITITNRKIK
jgi:hypothetical protein